MSSTTYTDCRDLDMVPFTVKPGQTSFRVWYTPRYEARLCRDINRMLAGEMPCQCNRCRTNQEGVNASHVDA